MIRPRAHNRLDVAHATSAGVKLSTRGRPRRTRYSLNRVLYAASSGATLGAAVRRRPAVAVVAGVAILVAVAVDTFVVARSIVLVRERLLSFLCFSKSARRRLVSRGKTST